MAATTLPKLPFDLRQHRRAILIYWSAKRRAEAYKGVRERLTLLLIAFRSLMVFTSGAMPIFGYFIIRYCTSLSLNVNWSIWTGITAVLSGYSMIIRTWRLFRKTSTCRPLGVTSRWALDYFDWNFFFGFIVLTAMISVGSSITSWPLVSLPLAVILLYVCFQLVAVQILTAFGITVPFRMSSTPAGHALPSACSVIIEDVIAVDGGAGQEFRSAWTERCKASPPLRSFLRTMDLLWGITGLLVAGSVAAVVFAVDNQEVGYVIGWGAPWGWAGVMAVLTMVMVKGMLQKEAEQTFAHSSIDKSSH